MVSVALELEHVGNQHSSKFSLSPTPHFWALTLELRDMEEPGRKDVLAAGSTPYRLPYCKDIVLWV